MYTYQNNSFSGETIELDGSAFRQCSFEDCTLRFCAAGSTELSGCTFAGSQLVADGAAKLTLSYLRAFYHGLGAWGRGCVDEMFEAIRRPDPADEPSAPPPPTPPVMDAPIPGPPALGAGDLLVASYRAALDAFGASPEGQTIVRGFTHLSPTQRQEIAALIGRAAKQAR